MNERPPPFVEAGFLSHPKIVSVLLDATGPGDMVWVHKP